LALLGCIAYNRAQNNDVGVSSLQNMSSRRGNVGGGYDEDEFCHYVGVIKMIFVPTHLFHFISFVFQPTSRIITIGQIN